MKVIERFDQHNSAWLRAILKEDTPVAIFSNQLTLPGHQLYEVWLLPEGAQFITPDFLEAACFNSVAELLKRYQFDETDFKVHAAGIEGRLVSDFGIGLKPNVTHFHYSVLETKDGPVISVVFGSYKAMEKMYDRDLRLRLRQEVSDECSD